MTPGGDRGALSTWQGAAVVSVVLSCAIGMALLGVAAGLGWIALDGVTTTQEIGVGILLLVICGVVSGAVSQLIAPVERGPEILIGHLVIVVVFVLIGRLFDAPRSAPTMAFGTLIIAAKSSLLCGVAARMAWTLRR